MKRLFCLKVKEGKEERVLAWFNYLQTQQVALLETLKEERLLREEWWKEERDGRLYLYATLDGEALPSNQNKEINQQHQEVLKECIEEKIRIEIILNLDVT